MRRGRRMTRAFSLVGLLLVVPLALGSTCTLVAAGPEDVTDGEESNNQIMQEEDERERERQMEL
jgi:hypothetical protein